MSLLESAHHFGVTTLNINIDARVYQGGISPRSVGSALYNHIAPGAIHDSSERCDAPKCHPETRKAVQEDIISWITSGDSEEEPSRVLWLTGPAGAGKTAIAGSVAEICEAQDLLAATFFFSSHSASSNRQSKRCLVSTLAHQIAQLHGYETFAERVLRAVEKNPAILNKHLKGQLEALIIRPLSDAQGFGGAVEHTKAIIIDGVDEVLAEPVGTLSQDEFRQACEADQVEILSTLLQAVSNPAFPFRILIASRPDRAIRNFFSEVKPNISRELFLDQRYLPDADIRLFLMSHFAEMRRRYHLPSSWPSTKIVEGLIGNASGQFIYAATIVRFLRTGDVSPRLRLDFVSTLRCSDDSINAFGPLDALYDHVLGSSPHPTLAIQWIRVINTHLDSASAAYTRQLLQEYPGQAEYLLENLTSLVHIPAHGDTEFPYRLYHKSLIDFLTDRGRCGEEYYRAYESGVELYHARHAHVFETLSVSVPLSDIEWRDFRTEFLRRLIGRFEEYLMWAGQSNEAFWSVVSGVIALTCTYKAYGLVCLAKLYHRPHDANKCRELHFGCHPLCRHWRSRIIECCKSQGWTVPGATALRRHSYSAGLFDVQSYFSPPNQYPSVSAERPKMKYQAAWSKCDDDYAALLPEANESAVERPTTTGRLN